MPDDSRNRELASPQERYDARLQRRSSTLLQRRVVEQERATIEGALAATQGRVAGPKGAAAKLGMPRQTLDSKIRALHIDKLKFRAR